MERSTSSATTRARSSGGCRSPAGRRGCPGKDPVSHILFIRDAFPDVYARTATFLEPVDYLNLRLTGRDLRPPSTPSPPTGSPTTGTSTAWPTTTGCSRSTGLDRAEAPRPGAAGDRSWASSPPGPPPTWACPAGVPVVGRLGGRALGRVRVGGRGRLRRPPLHRHLVVDLGPRPVQEDGARPPTWPPSRRPWPASTSSSTSTRRPAPASPSCATTWAWPPTSRP